MYFRLAVNVDSPVTRRPTVFTLVPSSSWISKMTSYSRCNLVASSDVRIIVCLPVNGGHLCCTTITTSESLHLSLTVLLYPESGVTSRKFGYTIFESPDHIYNRSDSRHFAIFVGTAWNIVASETCERMYLGSSTDQWKPHNTISIQSGDTGPRC